MTGPLNVVVRFIDGLKAESESADRNIRERRQTRQTRAALFETPPPLEFSSSEATTSVYSRFKVLYLFCFIFFRCIIKSRSLHLPWVPSLPLSLASILTFLSLLLRSRSPIVLIASLCPPLFVLWNVLHVSNCSRAFRALNCFHFHSVPSLPPFISSLRSSLEYPLVEKTKRR